MDPISTILAALAAGAVAAAKETTGNAIKDVYEGLKSLIKQKFGDKPFAKTAVDAHATEPQQAEAVLRPALKEAAADQDTELLAAAKALLAKADSDGSISRRYSLQTTGDVQGVVQGDHASVTMNFGVHKPDIQHMDQATFTVLYDISGSAIPYGKAVVDIAGKSLNLEVDENRQKDAQNISVTKPGSYSYHIILKEPLGSGVFKGEGQVEIKNGDIFTIEKGISAFGSVWLSRVMEPTNEEDPEEEELFNELMRIE